MSALSPMQGTGPIDRFWEDENYEPEPELIRAAQAALDRVAKRKKAEEPYRHAEPDPDRPRKPWPV